MKNKVAVGLVAMVAVVAAGALSVSAFGGAPWMQGATPEQVAKFQEEQFGHQAEFLGISVDKVKAAWASGKNMQELAKENGIDEDALHEKMKSERQERMQEHLKTLVSQGVITQAQADQRLSTIADREPGEGRGQGMGMHRGGGMGMGVGPAF